MKQPKFNTKQPLYYSIAIAIGMFIGLKMSSDTGSRLPSLFNFSFSSSDKLSNVLNLVKNKYVDSVNTEELENAAMDEILARLDPHSNYVKAKEFERMNQSLEGNFGGIGIEFHLLNDTLYVVAVLPEGPAAKAGLKSGDKIITINDELIAGIGIKNDSITDKIRGPRGTKVNLTILRKEQKALNNYTITRGSIPLKSIDVAYLITPNTGYIKISKFAATTHEEFLNSFVELNKIGIKNMIVDLRGNGGGYLNAATALADEFLEDKKLIVYTQGRKQARTDYYATSVGEFEKGKLIILIDEGSASASEILAGAIQDQDRGIIIGRRSFGKGLVQDQTVFPDGSALRLTIARYCTPSGRCIQKSYENGKFAYENELNVRYSKGELTGSPLVDTNPNQKSYKTALGKTVFGEGGISPDIYVPIDTSEFSPYYSSLIKAGIISEFSYAYTDQNRKFLSKFKSLKEFEDDFLINEGILGELINYAKKNGVNPQAKEIKISSRLIKRDLKSLIARQLWNDEGYYRIAQNGDNILRRALEELKK